MATFVQGQATCSYVSNTNDPRIAGDRLVGSANAFSARGSFIHATHPFIHASIIHPSSIHRTSIHPLLPGISSNLSSPCRATTMAPVFRDGGLIPKCRARGREGRPPRKRRVVCKDKLRPRHCMSDKQASRQTPWPNVQIRHNLQLPNEIHLIELA